MDEDESDVLPSPRDGLNDAARPANPPPPPPPSSPQQPPPQVRLTPVQEVRQRKQAKEACAVAVPTAAVLPVQGGAKGPVYDPDSPRYGEYGLFRNSRPAEVSYRDGKYVGLVHGTTGLPHGHGVKVYGGGGTLVCGQWVNGAPNGDCLFTGPGGEEYRGMWQDGVRHGPGVLVKTNGAVYHETYVAGTRSKRVLLQKPHRDEETVAAAPLKSAAPVPTPAKKPRVPRLSRRALVPQGEEKDRVDEKQKEKEKVARGMPRRAVLAQRQRQSRRDAPAAAAAAAVVHDADGEQVTVAMLLAES